MMSRPREATGACAHQLERGDQVGAGVRGVCRGTLSGGVYQNHRQQEAAKAEAARVAEQQQREMAATQLAKEDEEDLMANVDSDVARRFRARWSRWHP